MIESATYRIRLLAALPTGFALLLAFAVAPFEHVHSGDGPGHAAVIHAHFFEAHAPRPAGDGPGLDDDDDHASAWQLHNFTPVAPVVRTPSVPARGPVLGSVPTTTDEPLIAVEERGHDPPAIDLFPPRAPPA